MSPLPSEWSWALEWGVNSPFTPYRTRFEMRKHAIKIRLNDAEKAELVRRANLAGLPPAVYLREKISRGSIPNVAAIRERTGLLNRFNANLNMVARWCNVHKQAADSLAVKQELVSLARLIRSHFQERDH